MLGFAPLAATTLADDFISIQSAATSIAVGASVSASGGATRSAVSLIAPSASVTSAGVRVANASCAINTDSLQAVSSFVVLFGAAHVQCTTSTFGSAFAVLKAAASIAVNCNVVAFGAKKWEDAATPEEVWADAAETSTNWIDASEASQDWSEAA